VDYSHKIVLFAVVNFNYSYRAFLISCLLVGNLVLLLVSVKLSDVKPKQEAYTAVEYTEEYPEEEELIDVSEHVVIKTNTAYNEAEKFISEIENDRNAALENSEENIEQVEDKESTTFNEAIALNDAQERLNSVKEKLNNSKSQKKARTLEGVNRKTTISYNLKDRKALVLRNPVYTCDSSGKIVINIEVSDQGKVVKASYNKAASTTSNGCLIDSALQYANQSKFTTKAGRDRQPGTITYVFPGQY